jgi:hypothetical protein
MGLHTGRQSQGSRQAAWGSMQAGSHRAADRRLGVAGRQEVMVQQTGSIRAACRQAVTEQQTGSIRVACRQAVTEQQTGSIGAACRQAVIEQSSRQRFDRRY